MSSSPAPTLATERLFLRVWREDDRAEFARMNADPRVMEFMARALTREESDLFFDRICQHFALHGFGLWALEVKQGARFIGVAGLSVPSFKAPFTPCVEVGWRLAAEHWGQGYATEAARAALTFGFRDIALAEIVSFTTERNARSRRVMQRLRLGMHRDPAEDFDHPLLAADHPLVRHVLYRLRKDEWQKGNH